MDEKECKALINSISDTIETRAGRFAIFGLRRLEEMESGSITRLPYSIRILLENVLRHYDGRVVQASDVDALLHWQPRPAEAREVPFMPARVILQDFTGVPAVVDLAAMRSAMARMGGDPQRINPHIPVDLVIDHSVQVDYFGTTYAFRANVEREYERNRERYALLRWAQKAFENFRVVPPGTGIVHQVNLEYLACVVATRATERGPQAFPDTVLGTDSHTTMINGLGVLGWGVGGIEAEAVMLGQPYALLVPEVVGVRLHGQLPEGATATDLVLALTEMLRAYGVVGKFVEYFGPGLRHLALPDRSTLANMSPEYGATMGYFPVDTETLHYLRFTGRSEEHVALVETYTREQLLFYSEDAPTPEYSDILELDMSTVEPCIAGPRNPEERIPLKTARAAFRAHLIGFLTDQAASHPERVGDWHAEGGQESEATGTSVPSRAPEPRTVSVRLGSSTAELRDGAVVIAAITSCTNTSNPSVMLAAGLLARHAVERGLRPAPHVKTSLAPGSRVVTDYLASAGLLPFLEALRFHVVGYGCTTCIGNSGPLPEPMAAAIRQHDLVVAAVLSGNRNFEGRINPLVRFNYLASPPLVVAYALAGTMDIDLLQEPLGYDPNGQPIYLKDIWPSAAEIRDAMARALDPEMFRRRYATVFEGDERWQSLPTPKGLLYEWDPQSTYIQEPPFFRDLPLQAPSIEPIRGARILALLGDRITTDHISPAGAIPADSPAGRYLIEHGVDPHDFNTFGSRRGNHEVMMRGTFGNIRLRNQMVPDREGGWTIYWPTGETLDIYTAAMRYQENGTPLVVLAGRQYGAGSSRDWAAKGTALLGVRAVIAESFERIHRSNLVGMGVLPLEFEAGTGWRTLGLDGSEIIDIEGLDDQLQPHTRLQVRARHPQKGTATVFTVTARVDSHIEVEYLKHNGILPLVLRQLLLTDMH